jgi:hypothetical protein
MTGPAARLGRNTLNVAAGLGAEEAAGAPQLMYPVDWEAVHRAPVDPVSASSWPLRRAASGTQAAGWSVVGCMDLGVFQLKNTVKNASSR